MCSSPEWLPPVPVDPQHTKIQPLSTRANAPPEIYRASTRCVTDTHVTRSRPSSLPRDLAYAASPRQSAVNFLGRPLCHGQEVRVDAGRGQETRLAAGHGQEVRLAQG